MRETISSMAALDGAQTVGQVGCERCEEQSGCEEREHWGGLRNGPNGGSTWGNGEGRGGTGGGENRTEHMARRLLGGGVPELDPLVCRDGSGEGYTRAAAHGVHVEILHPQPFRFRERRWRGTQPRRRGAQSLGGPSRVVGREGAAAGKSLRCQNWGDRTGVIGGGLGGEFRSEFGGE